MTEPATTSQPDTVWHLDKRVPVALIITILLQTVGAGIWVGTIASRVTTLEQQSDRQSDQIDKGAAFSQQTATSLARLEEAVKALKESQTEGFRRIESSLREKARQDR